MSRSWGLVGGSGGACGVVGRSQRSCEQPLSNVSGHKCRRGRWSRGELGGHGGSGSNNGLPLGWQAGERRRQQSARVPTSRCQRLQRSLVTTDTEKSAE